MPSSIVKVTVIIWPHLILYSLLHGSECSGCQVRETQEPHYTNPFGQDLTLIRADIEHFKSVIVPTNIPCQSHGYVKV